MKIAFMCDAHIPLDKNSPQYAAFQHFINEFEKSAPDAVITLGDITSYGERAVFDDYIRRLKCFNHSFVIGNSDVRDKSTCEYIKSKSQGFVLSLGSRKLMGINTDAGTIDDGGMQKIRTLGDGDILVMHHGPHRLPEDIRAQLEEICAESSLVIIHGHSHGHFDYSVGKSRVIGLRALDPDKSIGGFPCITYFEISDTRLEYAEQLFGTSKDTILSIGANFGISCVDNKRDVLYALENKVYAVELRCNGSDWEPDYDLLPLVEKWRAKTGGYLSVHMPNLFYRDGTIAKTDVWRSAIEYAKVLKVNGLTIHPPRVRKSELLNNPKLWEEYLGLYAFVVQSVDNDVKIGIENLHMHRGENDDENRAFGYTPEEVCMWIDAINKRVGAADRVRHVLDVGHARNNGSIAERYPISRWYRIMGKKTVAYHIHQVIPTENGLKNHTPIEAWFGPMISYASFFYMWDKCELNHVPVFLEVRGSENYQKSLEAFKELTD